MMNHKIGLPVNTSDFSAYTNYQYKAGDLFLNKVLEFNIMETLELH